MTAAQWERLKPLFDEAINLPADGRAEFLARLCAEDAEIAARLNSLLENEGTTVTVSEPMVRLNDFRFNEKRFFNEGEMVIGRFRIVRFLGRGGMGEVYQAEDMQLGEVALKTLRPGVSLDQDSILRFRQEVQLARRVTSTNVCRIHDLFQVPGDRDRLPCSFLTMELLPGVTLADHIEREGPLPFAQAESVALELCAALEAIHDAGVIHRDFKSRNIMLVPRNGQPHAVVMDMGLAREAKPSDEDDSGITKTGAVMGTPEYMAPEQFEGRVVTSAADVYALGVVLYELATGIRPFRSQTPLGAAVMRAKRPVAASSIRAGVPKRWDEVISRCLEYEPEKRWSSATEVAGMLASARPRRRFGILTLGNEGSSSLGRRASAAPSPATPRHRRLTLGTISVALLLASIWPGWSSLSRLLHPLPEKRFVALMAWPRNTPVEMQPLLKSILSAIDNRLAREESSSRNLLLISSADTANQRPLAQPSDAMVNLGANLVLGSALRPTRSGAALDLQVLDASTGKILRLKRLSSPRAEYKLLAERASIAAAKLLDVPLSRGSQRNPDDMANVPPKAFDLFSSAEDLLDQPNDTGLDLAIEKYQKALDVAPSSASGYAALSMAYTRKYWKFHDSAALRLAGKNADLALRYDQDSSKSVLSKGMVELYSGNTERAMDSFGKALRLDPGNPKILFYEARAFRDLDRSRDEENTYRLLISERPNFWPAYNGIGSIFFRQGRYQEAAVILAEGATVAPRVEVILTNLGTIYLLLDRKREAEETFRKESGAVAE